MFQKLKRLTKALDADSKFGLYLSNGNNTCQGRAGSWGYEDQDAQYLARLKVDYLKCKSRQTNGVYVWEPCVAARLRFSAVIRC